MRIKITYLVVSSYKQDSVPVGTTIRSFLRVPLCILVFPPRNLTRINGPAELVSKLRSGTVNLYKLITLKQKRSFVKGKKLTVSCRQSVTRAQKPYGHATQCARYKCRARFLVRSICANRARLQQSSVWLYNYLA